MSKGTGIQRVREKKKQRTTSFVQHNRFAPCSPDMTICGDCEDNRAQNKCPRLKEWLEKRKS